MLKWSYHAFMWIYPPYHVFLNKDECDTLFFRDNQLKEFGLCAEIRTELRFVWRYKVNILITMKIQFEHISYSCVVYMTLNYDINNNFGIAALSCFLWL